MSQAAAVVLVCNYCARTTRCNVSSSVRSIGVSPASCFTLRVGRGVYCTQPAQACHDISAREWNYLREFQDSSCTSLSSTTRSCAGCRLSKQKHSSRAKNMFRVLVCRLHFGRRGSSIAERSVVLSESCYTNQDPPQDRGRDAVILQ